MKIVKFKDFIDYNKRLGKIIITGKEGAGKTMLLARIAVGKMLHGQQDCWKSYDAVEEYNALGYNFSTEYEHLAFANFDVNCFGTHIPDRKIYRCNPYRLGLYDPNYYTDYYPPYSSFFLTEGYNFLNSYQYNRFRDSFKGWLKTSRQLKYDMIVDTHSVSDIFTKFKKITNRFINLFEDVEDVKNHEGIIVSHYLYVREWHDYHDVEVYEQSAKLQNCDEYKLDLGMCMHKNYDTEYCRFLGLEGRDEQDFNIETFPEIVSKEDLINFGERFGIMPPEGFFVSKGKKADVEPSPPADELTDADFEFDDAFNIDF